VETMIKKAGRPKNNTVGQRRDELLATALDMFLEHGYDGVSLTTLAQVAHVAIRTIYVKFGGKDELLHAILAAEAASHARQIDDLDLDGLPFQDKMERLAVHLWERSSDPRLLRLKAIVFAHPDRRMADEWRAANPGQLAGVAKREFAAASQLFDETMPPELLWEHFLSCVLGSCAILGEYAEVVPKERIARSLVLFMNAVSCPADRLATSDTAVH